MFGFVSTQGQMISPHSNLDGIAERCEADQLDLGADQETKFHEPPAVFRGDIQFRHVGSGPERQGGQGLTGQRHDVADFSVSVRGSTRMERANCSLRPRRVLQTWQIIAFC